MSLALRSETKAYPTTTTDIKEYVARGFPSDSSVTRSLSTSAGLFQ